MSSIVNHCKHCDQDFIDWIQGETMCEDCMITQMKEYAEADAHYEENFWDDRTTPMADG